MLFTTKNGFILDDGDDTDLGEVPQDPEFWKDLRDGLRTFHQTMRIEHSIQCDDVWNGSRRELRANGIWARFGYLFTGMVWGLIMAMDLSTHWLSGLIFLFALCTFFCSRMEHHTRIRGSECARGLQLGLMVLTNSAKVVRR